MSHIGDLYRKQLRKNHHYFQTKDDRFLVEHEYKELTRDIELWFALSSRDIKLGLHHRERSVRAGQTSSRTRRTCVGVCRLVRGHDHPHGYLRIRVDTRRDSDSTARSVGSHQPQTVPLYQFSNLMNMATAPLTA